MFGAVGSGCFDPWQPVLVLQKSATPIRLAQFASSASNLFDVKAIHDARARRNAWANSVEQIVESFYDSLPLVDGERFSWAKMSGQGHKQFDVIGPIGPHCVLGLERYGNGDEEKRVCGLSRVEGNCVVVSIGSNNQWDFEMAVAQRTRCRIVTFDCTCGPLRPPTSLAHRISTYEICIGPRNFVNERGWQFMDWPTALAHAGVSQVTHLKMDIEGFEYSVLRDIVNHRLAIAPSQISLELHYQSQMEDLSWTRRHKTAGEIALFMLMLFHRASYFVVDRHDNPRCPHCCELVLARFPPMFGFEKAVDHSVDAE